MTDHATRSSARAGCLRVLAAALLLLLPTSVAGLSEYRDWTVEGIEVTGVPKPMAGELEGGLALNVRSGFLRSRRPRFSEEVLDQDRQRILLYLARRGYPHAEVEARIDPRSRRRIHVVMEVAPGAAVHFGELGLSGLPPALETPARGALTRVRKGELFADDAVVQAKAAMEELLHDASFARSQVNDTLLLHDSATVALGLEIVPGDPYRFASVSAGGAAEDLLPLARKTMAIKPGTPYSPEVIERARDNLRYLGLFRQIRLEWDDVGPETLNLHADLQERDPRTAKVSFGSWTDDPWRFAVEWTHRNLFRRGRGFLAEAAYSKHRRLLASSVWWLARVLPRTRTSLLFDYEIEDEESYFLKSIGVGVGMLYGYSRNSSVSLGVTLQDVHVDYLSVDAPVYEAETGKLAILSAKWFRDASDHILIPTNGTRLTLGADWSPPGVLSESPFVTTENEGVLYLPVWGEGVLAQRINLGAGWPLGDLNALIPNRRFYAGGVSTMRGYRRRMLGPLDSAGNPIGGEARVLFNAELRVPFVWLLGANLFVDVGQVWMVPDDVRLADLKVALGSGVALRTPIGPIRFDAAWNTTPPPEGQSRTAVHFSVGNPF